MPWNCVLLCCVTLVHSLETKIGCGEMIHYFYLDKKATFDIQGALFTSELINHNISVRWTPS